MAFDFNREGDQKRPGRFVPPSGSPTPDTNIFEIPLRRHLAFRHGDRRETTVAFRTVRYARRREPAAGVPMQGEREKAVPLGSLRFRSPGNVDILPFRLSSL